jgi:hypothetical protein
MRKRLLALPLVFALFFAPLHVIPDEGAGTAEAATVAAADGPLAGDVIVSQDAGPEDGQTKDTPWAVILPLAFGIPLAVLVVPAFLRRGGGGH